VTNKTTVKDFTYNGHSDNKTAPNMIVIASQIHPIKIIVIHRTQVICFAYICWPFVGIVELRCIRDVATISESKKNEWNSAKCLFAHLLKEKKMTEEAKLWINKHSPNRRDCYEYTLQYMNDITIVNKITNWLQFQSIVRMLGYDVHVDVCENEWYESPRTN
jgi:hypothetical protein